MRPGFYPSGWLGNQYGKTIKIGAIFSKISFGLSAYQTYGAFNNIVQNKASFIDYPDAIIGTTGLSAEVAGYFGMKKIIGLSIPGVGEAVLLYEMGKIVVPAVYYMGQTEAQYRESNLKRGKWYLNLDH